MDPVDFVRRLSESGVPVEDVPRAYAAARLNGLVDAGDVAAAVDWEDLGGVDEGLHEVFLGEGLLAHRLQVTIDRAHVDVVEYGRKYKMMEAMRNQLREVLEGRPGLDLGRRTASGVRLESWG